MRKPNPTCRTPRSEDAVGRRVYRLVHHCGRILAQGPVEVSFADEAEARGFADRFLCDAPAWRCVAAPAPARRLVPRPPTFAP